MLVSISYTDIDSHKRRMEERKKAATEAIERNDWWTALIAISDAIEHKGAIGELEYQIEAQEVAGTVEEDDE